jgi:hypothetical protein
MDKVLRVNKFTRILKEKCQKENADFDKEFTGIKNYNGLEKEDYIFALQDVQAFKEKFLISHYKMYNLLDYVNQRVNSLRQENLTEEDIQKAINELEDIKTDLANSKIEIYFCNVSDNKALVPFANAAMPYGLIHVGLMIDDVAIQWGRSVLGKSVINPSADVIYNDYIFAIELDNQPIWDYIKETYKNLRDYITNKKDYNSMGTVKAFLIANNQLNIIAERSVQYNVDKDYNLVLKNCQHFASKTIEMLGLKVNKDGYVGKILAKTMEELNKFNFTYDGVEFKNRKMLDEYILTHDFSRKPKDERRALLCFRNVFDFYARCHPDDDNYKSTDYAKAYWNELAEIEKFGK